jgi:AraC-like DNA-binding protein
VYNSRHRRVPRCTFTSTALYDAHVKVLKRAETKVALLKKAEALVGRLRENEKEHDHLLEERATMCKELREAGASIEDLQSVLGISRSRIQQILRAATPAS